MNSSISEAERVRYLDAMGVVSYIPRIELPGAKPSALCDGSGFENAQPEPAVVAEPSGVLKNKPGKETLQQLQASLTSPVKAAPAKPATRVVPGPAPRVTSVAQKTPAAMAVHFHWAMLQPSSSMLLLVPVSHLGQPQLELLKKILGAIHITVPALSTQEQISWPPDRKPTGASTFTIDDAREMLQALLQGWQKRFSELRHVLVFDPHLGKTLFQEIHVEGIHLRILPSLQEMTVNPPEKIAEAKHTAWQILKELKTS